MTRRRSTPRTILGGLCSLSLAATACGGTPTRVEARAVGSATTSASSAAPPRPPAPFRKYQRGAPITPVVEGRGSYKEVAVSPDGLLVAMIGHGQKAVRLVDTDRGRVVAQTPVLQSGSPERLTWAANDALFIEGRDVVAQVDGRTGRLVARVSGARPGVVRTDAGWAVLIASAKAGSLTLVDITHPEKVLARVPAVEARETLDLGGGAFAVVSGDGVIAYEPGGQKRWSWAHAIPWGTKVATMGASPRVVRIAMGGAPTLLSAEDGSPVGGPPDGALAHPGGAFFTCTVTRDGKRLIVDSHDDVVLYDGDSYRELRRWPGQGNQVTLDPTNRFALVFKRIKSGLGPLETTQSFVEDLATRKKVVDLDRAEGSFAFDPAGNTLAFTPGNGYPSYGESIVVRVYDLVRDGPPKIIQTEEAIERVQYLADGVLAIFLKDRVVLHRTRDARELIVHAVPEARACQLFATDDAGHFTGDPGGRLGLRFGDDLRTSEIVWKGPAFDALRDDRLIADFFADASTRTP